MNETFRLLLSLSVSGSILALLIFAIKPFIRHKLSKSIQYYIWIVVVLRLILPFSFEESIMNNVFYGDQKPLIITSSQGQANTYPSPVLPNVQGNVSNGTYNNDADHSRYFSDLFSQYVFYIWLLGVFIALAVNLNGYTRFSKHLKQSNRPAADEDSRVLATLLKGRKNVRLARNPFAVTPMLIGILRPLIIIPDISFTEKQLKNILLHEVVHLIRFDVGIKWLTMIAVSLHWFNPLVYFIKREINHACELSCDEAVIRNLNAEEKQSYGDTLISVVSDNKYPIGTLQATMSEEKETLKERLVAIMKYSEKSKAIMLMSIVLVVAVIGGAVVLGGCIGKTGLNVSNEQEQLMDNFYQSVNYDPGQDLLSFTVPETIPEGHKFYLHVSGRMFMGDKNNGNGMSFHAFDEESQNYSWENGKTYTYPLQSESLDDCMLVFGLIDVNNQELFYTIYISPDGKKSIDNTYKLLGFIKSYDEKTRVLTFDEIEWVLQQDTKRVGELGLNADLDFPNGYYIYNESEQENSLKVADDVKVYLVDWSDLATPSLTDVKGLAKRMKEYKAPYHLTIKDGVIVEILEQYRP